MEENGRVAKERKHRDMSKKFTLLKLVEISILVEVRQSVSPVKDKLETLVLVIGITVFTVKVVGVVIVGLLTRLAVLAT